MTSTPATSTSAASFVARSPLGPPGLAFVAGLLFGIGLLMSGLTDPAKVLAFLDVIGAWDPTLLITMAAAVVISLVAFRVASRRSHTLIGLPVPEPADGSIDRRLLLGSLLFGIGWGLAGICPGPGFVAIGTGSGAAGLFVGSMLAGMKAFDRVARDATQTPQQEIRHVRRTTH